MDRFSIVVHRRGWLRSAPMCRSIHLGWPSLFLARASQSLLDCPQLIKPVCAKPTANITAVMHTPSRSLAVLPAGIKWIGISARYTSPASAAAAGLRHQGLQLA